MTAQDAESVAVIVAAWQHKLDACGLELWQRNAASHKGKWGEGPIDLASLAKDAVTALARHSDGPAHNPEYCGCEAEIACLCPCRSCNPPAQRDG